MFTAALASMAASACAQQLLTYAGSPLQIEYPCTAEDMLSSGLHCTAEDPCRVYLELAALEPVGARLFVAGNLHTGSVTLQSVLLASADAGRTWSEPAGRVRGASLEHIKFFDYETGWVAGQLLLPLPRDPFLLLTTDGGATWRRRPVFSESRHGAIEMLRFDSRTDGTAWIDRTQSGESGALFERYESTTGGESWVLREAVGRRPPGLAGAARAETGWRLRADQATQSYRVERSGPGGWQLAAAFSILSGECRPAPAPLPEAPPEPAPVPEPPRKKK